MNVRAALPALLVLLAGCSGTPNVPYLGIGKLPLDVLAVTSVNPETDKVSSKVTLRWQSQPGAKLYEVIRTFGSNPAKAVASQDGTSYTDDTLSPGQSATYKVRVLNGESKEINTSDDKAVTVQTQSVGKANLTAPADNATLGVGDNPELKWDAVEGANWYYVRVVRGDNDSAVYTALTKEKSIKFGDASPLKFSAFGDLFPTEAKSSITRGIIYRWTVQSIRANVGESPDKANSLDVNTSPTLKFSQG
jgi:predicted component of type VI protein secretion system